MEGLGSSLDRVNGGLIGELPGERQCEPQSVNVTCSPNHFLLFCCCFFSFCGRGLAFETSPSVSLFQYSLVYYWL